MSLNLLNLMNFFMKKNGSEKSPTYKESGDEGSQYRTGAKYSSGFHLLLTNERQRCVVHIIEFKIYFSFPIVKHLRSTPPLNQSEDRMERCV